MAPQALNATRDVCNTEGIDARGGGNVNVNRFAAEKGKSILLGLALGLSMAVNIIAFLSWREARTETQVKDYDLTFFVTHDFATLKSEVEVNQKLIEAYGLQKTLKEK
jgi:hypothetical protein